MSEYALIASWGLPGLLGNTHTYSGIWGERKRYIYRPCELCTTTIVYIDKYSVTGWSKY